MDRYTGTRFARLVTGHLRHFPCKRDGSPLSVNYPGYWVCLYHGTCFQSSVQNSKC